MEHTMTVEDCTYHEFVPTTQARVGQLIAAAVAAERERCAAIAWSHYMNTCLEANLAPSMWQKWCASDAIRRA